MQVFYRSSHNLLTEPRMPLIQKASPRDVATKASWVWRGRAGCSSNVIRKKKILPFYKERKFCSIVPSMSPEDRSQWEKGLLVHWSARLCAVLGPEGLFKSSALFRSSFILDPFAFSGEITGGRILFSTLVRERCLNHLGFIQRLRNPIYISQ